MRYRNGLQAKKLKIAFCAFSALTQILVCVRAANDLNKIVEFELMSGGGGTRKHFVGMSELIVERQLSQAQMSFCIRKSFKTCFPLKTL